MSNYVRRYTSDPGADVLLDIESVNILDLEPPASIAGIGSGVALVFGEFENGPFNTLTEVTSAEDLVATFGDLGYTYQGTTGNNPSARSRKADNTPVAETWNGNGFVHLSGKKFKRLVISRVDTSEGSVLFTRRAAILGTSKPTYAIANGQTVIAKINGAGPATATFTSAVATVTGAGATYAITGGETLTLGYDDQPDFTVQFLSTDTTCNACVSRINAAAGYTMASNSGGQIKLDGRKPGTAGRVRVVAGAIAGGGGSVSGLTIATTNGTGNVASAWAVTPAEVKSIIEAGIANSVIEFKSDGTPRICSITAGTGTVEITGGTAADLGFPVSTDDNTSGTAGTIPAGTIVKTVAGNKFVTMQDVAVTASNAGPYNVKVRHATDDLAGTTATAGTVVVVDSVIDFDAFGVTNAVVLAALTEAQVDAAYVTAIDSSVDINTIAKLVGITYSARQSNAVRRELRANVISASANGCYGRVTCVRPPLNTAKANAKGSSEPGCGAYRSDRVVYNYPGASTMVPRIARIGISGGTGFTADGVVDVGSDGFCACVMSQLAPEENPGQLTGFTTGVVGLESGANAQGFTIADYIAFKAAGICALRIEDGTAIFQSGVVNVDPVSFSSLKNIARRRMADYIQDSLATKAKPYGKKLMTLKRRKALESEIRAFLVGLLSTTNPDAQRISAFSVDAKSGNTPDTIARGMFRIIVKVTTLASMDSIVLQTTIGETVQVDELPLAA